MEHAGFGFALSDVLAQLSADLVKFPGAHV